MSSAKLILGSIIRHGLTVLFAWLIARGWMSKDVVSSAWVAEVAFGAAGVVTVLGASLWQKAVSKWKFLAALQAPSTPPASIPVASAIVDDRSKQASIAETLAVINPLTKGATP
jgi:hypothetical protein